MTDRLVISRVARVLEHRLAALLARVEDGQETAWAEFLEVARVLATFAPLVAPGARGDLLTTKQMAERLGIAPKTLLRRRAKGQAVPALQLGRRGRAAIRWRGDEAVR
jgi:hypothetical protein